MSEIVWLLLAGDFSDPFRLPKHNETVIAVDGGMRHAASLGVKPNLWLGDFDSSDELESDVKRITFPQDKNETDFELALTFVRKHHHNLHCLMVIGSDGNEADHSFGNLWVLPQFGLPALLFGKNGVKLFAAGAASWRLYGKTGDKVSIFALSPLQDLCYEGLRWHADKLSLPPFTALAARNELIHEKASIKWSYGTGVVFIPQTVSAELVFNT